MPINLENYVEVSERIELFRTKYPEGTYRTEVVDLPAAFAGSFIAVRALAYRWPDDEFPGVDMAWEPVPGKTPYTKDSELQNACTSAIGRAIIAVGAADARRGIASREEVQNREQPSPRPRSGPQKRTPTPKPEATEKPVEAPQTNGGPSVVSEVARMKRWAVEQLSGNIEEAQMIWAKVLDTYELDKAGLPHPDSLQFLESDLSIAVGEALTEELVES